MSLIKGSSATLKVQGAKVNLWGVGTNLITAKGQPALDGVYKLSAIQNKKGKWVNKLKISEQLAKTTNPGTLQVRRFYDKERPLQICFTILKKGFQMLVALSSKKRKL
uniref:hypothetical protein n=1 Tax=Candidatus Neptunichlamydia sp. REUL1 TaxID=3064277 RepID=UPI0029310D10|nr:hypothetical protein [Candidatus Neptunochlamydia sp. REUL1]